VVYFKRNSVVHYIRPDDHAALQGLKYTFLTLVLGWWGIPWGPIYTVYTVQAIINNFQGGTDVTTEMMSAFVSAASQPPQKRIKFARNSMG
jgi:hypothetical protein